MRRTTRIIGGASIVLAPLSFGIVDQLRMVSDPPVGAGMVNPDYGVESAAATLASIQANPGPFVAAAWVEYAGVFLAITALVAIWWLAVGRAPKWAWAGAVLATLGVIGQVVHLTAYYGFSQVLAGREDLTAAAEVMIAAEENALMMALFVPFLLGLLAAVAQAIGLRRARVVPLWAVLAIVGGTGLMLATGSLVWSSALHTALLVAGFAPAALAFLRGHAVAEPAPALAPEPVPA